MTNLKANFRGRIRARRSGLVLNVDFDTFGGRLVVVGPNGAGKSSFLKALIGALPVEEGYIELGDTRLVDTETKHALPMERRGIGYLPQSYAVFRHLTVRQNVEFPLVGRGLARNAICQQANELMHQLGIAPLAERNVTSLSGGETQRVGLARALASAPSALLLDEPLAALDPVHREEVTEFLLRHLEQAGVPTVLTTHSVRDAKVFGSRILALEAGAVTQCGTFEELESNPATSFVEQFVGQ
jgi:molybdate transport system ATP-binding protein